MGLMAGLAGPGTKILEFGIFQKGTLALMGCGYFVILCYFIKDAPCGIAGALAGGPGPTIKSWNFDFLH